MKYHSKYAEKVARRNHAPKIVRSIRVNDRSEIVGPMYGVEFKTDPDTGESVPHYMKRTFAKEVRATPFFFELGRA